MISDASPFQAAIDELEKDIRDLERKWIGLVDAVNILRAKAGLPPRDPSGPGGDDSGTSRSGGVAQSIGSDQFYGKRMGAAAREYLEMRKASGAGPAKPREIYEALKAGGYEFRGKDESNQMVVLRTTLRKSSQMFHKLPNGLWGLKAWYPGVKEAKETAQSATDGAAEDGSDAEKSGKTAEAEGATAAEDAASAAA